jgi:hypothetical protein
MTNSVDDSMQHGIDEPVQVRAVITLDFLRAGFEGQADQRPSGSGHALAQAGRDRRTGGPSPQRGSRFLCALPSFMISTKLRAGSAIRSRFCSGSPSTSSRSA